MAPPRRRLLRSNSSVLVSVCDGKLGYLVFRFDVKRLFSDEADESSRSRSRRRPREVLPLPPSPVACFRRPVGLPMELVASSGGDKIVAATTDGHIMVYDVTRSQCTYDHDLGCKKPWPVLLSSSGAAAEGRRRRRRHDDDMSMLVASELLYLSEPHPYFEALRLTSGGRLHPLPVPPPLLFGNGDDVEVTCYFVARGRAWLSVWCKGVKGTYSLPLDMKMAARGEPWRREGSWVVPLEGRAVYAPDLGLLLGFNRGSRALLAVDMKMKACGPRRPVIRQQWTKRSLLPSKDEGFSEKDYITYGGLAYLGEGRLCISWSSPHLEEGQRMILALTALEISVTKTDPNNNGGPPELLLRKRRSRCYRLPPDNRWANVLPLF